MEGTRALTVGQAEREVAGVPEWAGRSMSAKFAPLHRLRPDDRSDVETDRIRQSLGWKLAFRETAVADAPRPNGLTIVRPNRVAPLASVATCQTT